MAMISDTKDGRARFFAYARERHATHLRRIAGEERPWTKEPILQEYRFTNVFRELDKTTEWFRKNVRDPLRDKPEALLATVLFRMLNRIEVGEALFTQNELFPVMDPSGEMSAFEKYLDDGDVRDLRRAIKAAVPRGPYVTGAYIISTPPGYKKLDGALKVVDDFAKTSDWRRVAESWMRGGSGSTDLQFAFKWLQDFDYLGSFHSYEIVTDLRHTKLLGRARDVNKWANIGPGCRRGMNRIMERTRPGDVSGRKRWGLKLPDEDVLSEMRALLSNSLDARYWPQFSKTAGWSKNAGEFRGAGDWPRWEMRDVEHTLCEFDKFERVHHGEGRPRGKFS
jgi:hypothetical protein